MTENEHVPTWWETADRLVLASLPVVGGPLGVLYDDITKRRQARVNQFGAAVLARVDVDAFIEACKDERLCDLFVSALQGAASSGWEAKRLAMAKALANAANTSDDAEVDVSEAYIAALLDMEAVHFIALAGTKGTDIATAREVEFLPPVMAVLLRNGAVQTVTGMAGEVMFFVTNFGRALLHFVRSVEARTA